MIKAIGVIPARLGSTRLEAKVLKILNGKPVIEHVWNQAKKASKLDEVLVACDDELIKKCVEGFGGVAVMTSQAHPNGSCRVAEAVASRQDVQVVVNIQGDEPFINPENIDRLVQVFEEKRNCSVATLAVRKTQREDFENPNVVKVVCDKQGKALYFSRAGIPFERNQRDAFDFLKHLGIYGYRRDFLLHFVEWPVSALEDKEKLEQLRMLDHGVEIEVVETMHDSLGIDTAEDLALAESIMKQREN